MSIDWDAFTQSLSALRGNHNQLVAENERLKKTIETQGKGCMERHNIICEIHEITEKYFQEFVGEKEKK